MEAVAQSPAAFGCAEAPRTALEVMPGQLAAVVKRWGLRRLWVVAMSRHSVRAAICRVGRVW